MSALPTMDRTAKPKVEPARPLAQPEGPPNTPEVMTIALTLPYITAPPVAAGYQDEASRIDMGTLTRERMRKVKALRRGYVASDARMSNGSEVKTNRDALFCLLDALDI